MWCIPQHQYSTLYLQALSEGFVINKYVNYFSYLLNFKKVKIELFISIVCQKYVTAHIEAVFAKFVDLLSDSKYRSMLTDNYSGKSGVNFIS